MHNRVPQTEGAANDITISGIPAGAYLLPFSTGQDWDEATQSFRQDAAFAEFEKALSFTEDTQERADGKTTTYSVHRSHPSHGSGRECSQETNCRGGLRGGSRRAPSDALIVRPPRLNERRRITCVLPRRASPGRGRRIAGGGGALALGKSDPLCCA